MAGKVKRGPRGPVEPRTVVDLNLWDVLLGLMEPAEAPLPPERERKRGQAIPDHTSEVEMKEAPTGTAKAARRNVGQGSRRPNSALKKRGSSAGGKDEHDQCGTVGGREGKQVRRRLGQELPQGPGPD
jgi:hypothetical protein